MISNDITVVGSIALDTLETSKGNRKNLLGGSATYFSLSASLFSPVELIGIVFCKKSNRMQHCDLYLCATRVWPYPNKPMLNSIIILQNGRFGTRNVLNSTKSLNLVAIRNPGPVH